MSTSLIQLIVGLFTGKRAAVQPQPPTEMSNYYREVMSNPQAHQMLKHSFIGSKATVKAQIKEFIVQTRANELIAVTNNL